MGIVRVNSVIHLYLYIKDLISKTDDFSLFFRKKLFFYVLYNNYAGFCIVFYHFCIKKEVAFTLPLDALCSAY